MRRMAIQIPKVLFVAILTLMIQPYLLHSFDEMPPSDAISAAQQGIKTFVKDSRVQNLDKLGFLNKAQIDGATLGKGFQVFYISPNQLLDQELSQDIASLVRPTNMWQFLIVTGEKAASLLTVDFVENRWISVSLGASGLSAELGSILEAWPRSAGYQYRLIKAYQAKSDFIEVFLDGKTLGMVPLTSGRIAMDLEQQGFNPLDLYESDDILTKLRPIVRTNVQ